MSGSQLTVYMLLIVDSSIGQITELLTYPFSRSSFDHDYVKLGSFKTGVHPS